MRPSRVLSASAEAIASGSGIVLHQDQHALGAFEVRPEPLRAGALDGALDGGLDHAIPERGQGHLIAPGSGGRSSSRTTRTGASGAAWATAASTWA